MTKYFAIILMLGFIYKIQAQSSYLKLVTKSNESNFSVLKTLNKQLSTNKIIYQDTLEYYYPGAKSKSLQQILSIKVDNRNLSSIKDLLSKSNYFNSIEVIDDSVSIDACTNPITINDTWIANNWAGNSSLEMIEASCAWGITKGDPSIKVGIADTYLETTHEDLIDRISLIILNNITGGNPHGTEVSGCALTTTNNSKGIAGIGYNTKLYFHSVEHSPSGSASSVDIKNAIWNLHLAGADVINASWSGTGLDIAAAQEIINSGKILVLPAGNTPNANNNTNLANIPGVILVSSVDHNNYHGPTNRAHNSYVDVCAPGENITSTHIGNTYGSSWGTSMSSPLVAGLVALLKSVNPCLTPAEFENILKQTCDPIADATNFPGQLGAGRINAYNSVKKAGTAYIQNENISANKTVSIGYRIYAGYSVTTEKPNGNATVSNNSNLTLKARDAVVLTGGFTVELGSTLSISVDPNVVVNCSN